MNKNCYYCGDEYTKFMKLIRENEHTYMYMAGYQKQYPGRCIVTLKNHKEELFELSEEERIGFFNDVAKLGKAISKAYPCTKLNYGTCGDTNRHFHMHIVPKIENGFGWGDLFDMLPPENERIMISENELDLMIEKIRKKLEA